eukprot:TRINITY_DN37977_c0_g1_i2.p2 TRINITY_DN37977_c0_g1~~TRINITY_DN37977_c0_g1_i2.p2  ORF type:complete len:225 (+),score=67.09 TRINITY_DN37977_c0_g1_i2:28-675(+)
MKKPRRISKAKSDVTSKKKAGVLAGKVKQLLPEALDIKSLLPKGGDSEDDDDGPPEEVATVSGPVGSLDEDEGPPEEVQNITSLPSEVEATRTTRKTARKKAARSEKSQNKYAWQDPENKEALNSLKEQEAAKRRRRTGNTRLEKDGVVLVREGAAQAPVDADLAAADFFAEELFSRRKRKRTMADRYDRNVLGARSRSHAMHQVLPKKQALKPS